LQVPGGQAEVLQFWMDDGFGVQHFALLQFGSGWGETRII
jgi:hypothetical protein